MAYDTFRYSRSKLDIWLSLLPKNSIIIDGGNSDFRLTKKEQRK